MSSCPNSHNLTVTSGIFVVGHSLGDVSKVAVEAVDEASLCNHIHEPGGTLCEELVLGNNAAATPASRTAPAHSTSSVTHESSASLPITTSLAFRGSTGRPSPV